MKNNFGIYDLTNCSKLNYKERILIYKNVGFKELALYLDDNYMQEKEKYTDIINFARKQGLEIKQVHIDYKISNMICDKQSNNYFDYLEKKANECRTLKIPYLVLHASKGDDPPIISKEQLNKLTIVTRKYLDITFCFENVRNNTNLKKILLLDEPNIKMCYDLGHAHAYGNELELFNKYQEKIICSHLHNNYGKDDHNILQDGEINYTPILNQLINIKDASNCLECFPKHGQELSKTEFEIFVKKCSLFNNIETKK